MYEVTQLFVTGTALNTSSSKKRIGTATAAVLQEIPNWTFFETHFILLHCFKV